MITMTDGLENASKVFTAPHVFDLIIQRRDLYKWDFVYPGANQDAIATAAKMGIDAASARPYAADRTATTNAVNGLHQSLGFEHIGVLSGVGGKLGRALDILIMQKFLPSQ